MAPQDRNPILEEIQELRRRFESKYHRSMTREEAGILNLAEKLLNQRLLFVDDEPGIRATLPVILRRRGFNVDVAATVGEALNFIRTAGFDLLLCDLNIERERDGFVVIREMRSVNPHSVIVVLTGYPDFDSAVEGIRTKVDDYLMKPTDVDLLLKLLTNKLATQQAHQTGAWRVSH